MPDTIPNMTSPENQGFGFEWTPGSGKINTVRFKGTRELIDQLAQTIAVDWTLDGKNVSSMTGTLFNGRGNLDITLSTEYQTDGPQANPDGIVEEIYGVDVVKDVETAPLFEDVPGDQMIAVIKRVEDGLGVSDNFSNKQALLYQMLAHGQTSYFETAFVYRRSVYKATSETVGVSFTGINRVVNTPPELSTRMQLLIDALPAGEWLYKPPQAAYVGQGKYHLTQEWIWAEKHSVIYGGSLDYGVQGL